MLLTAWSNYRSWSSQAPTLGPSLPYTHEVQEGKKQTETERETETHRYTHIQAERDRDTETEAETEKDSQKERKHPGAL